MPYAVTAFTLPCGAPATRADGSGVITKEDADALVAKIGLGGDRFGIPLLVNTQRMVKLTAEARHAFSTPSDPNIDQAWCAVVVTSAVIRVTVNFLLRVNKAAAIKMFSSDADAIRWLDERVRMDGPTIPARQKPPRG